MIFDENWLKFHLATSANSDWKKANTYQKEEVYICPTDNHFVQGTYFIAVLAATETVFDLQFEQVFVAPKSQPQAVCATH